MSGGQAAPDGHAVDDRVNLPRHARRPSDRRETLISSSMDCAGFVSLAKVVERDDDEEDDDRLGGSARGDVQNERVERPQRVSRPESSGVRSLEQKIRHEEG